MKCNFCSNDPCVCGEAYKGLPDAGIITLLCVLTTEAKSRKINISCLIDDVDITATPANTNSSPLLSQLTMKYNLPDCYVKYLQQKENTPINQIIDDLINNDKPFVKFPLLLLIYATYSAEQSTYAAKLVDIVLLCIFDASEKYIEHWTTLAQKSDKTEFLQEWHMFTNSLIRSYDGNEEIRDEFEQRVKACKALMSILDTNLETTDYVNQVMQIMKCFCRTSTSADPSDYRTYSECDDALIFKFTNNNLINTGNVVC